MEIRISRHSPSFSSTLLDSIYRSIDYGEDEMSTYTEVLRKNKQNYTGANVSGVLKTEEQMVNFRRACMIDQWMEKKAVDLQTKKPRKSDRLDNSSRSSSDSSGGGFFSSSEAESFPLPKPKPVRTGLEKVRLGQSHREPELDRRGRRDSACELDPKPKDEGGFLKTKLKMYGDLKKVKQPISPGGKLAGFLNSLFAGAGKPKMAARGGDYSPPLKSTNASTCSSASSFSRSCLSKTPSSGGKSSNGVKRSVRFSQASVMVDEDCQPRVHQNNTNKEENHLNLLRNYQMKARAGRESELSFDNLRKPGVKSRSVNQGFDYGEEDEDDAASCASSDLFELDNLSDIGMDQRYCEELPVYETTQLDHTKRALANGMIF